jgi:hypothetical protein
MRCIEFRSQSPWHALRCRLTIFLNYAEALERFRFGEAMASGAPIRPNASFPDATEQAHISL